MRKRLDLLTGTFSRTLAAAGARQHPVHKPDQAEMSAAPPPGDAEKAAGVVPARFLLTSGQNAVLRVDADGRILDANEVALRLLGQEPGALEGRPLGSILVDQFMGAWMMNALLDSGFVVGEEVNFRGSDGAQIPVVCSGAVVRETGGTPVEIVWMARKRATRNDLDERLQALEMALQRERADRLHVAAELRTVRESRGKEEREPRPVESGGEKGGRDQLWAWAEEELRRVQGALQRTRERLFRVEEELQRTIKDRDWADERRRRSEEEVQRVREELQRLERQMRAAANEPGAGRLDSGNGRLASLTPEHYAALLQQGTQFPGVSGIDWNDALGNVDGDVVSLSAIAEALVADLPQLLRALQKATQGGDAGLIERDARTVKGAVKGLGATAAAQAAAALEAIGRSGDLTEAEDACTALQIEVEKLKPAFAALRKLS
jgi:PAS domain S-box-containing protein